MTTVVAAVISQAQKILICQRRADGAHALKWEFPGGKVEAGESLEEALKRELTEELGITIERAEEIKRYKFAYPGKQPILLVFFEVPGCEWEPTNLVFQRIEWSDISCLRSYDFLEGDEEFVRYLTSKEDRSRTAQYGPDSTSS